MDVSGTYQGILVLTEDTLASSLPSFDGMTMAVGAVALMGFLTYFSGKRKRDCILPPESVQLILFRNYSDNRTSDDNNITDIPGAKLSVPAWSKSFSRDAEKW